MNVISHGIRLSILAVALLPASAAAAEETLTLNVTGANDEPLAYAVAYVTSPELAELAAEGPPPAGEVDQRDQQFRPHAQAVQRGTLVRFPNRDQVRHHVYSFSEAKTFELALYADESPRPIEFDETGVVILGCNIHDHMTGYLLVVNTPVFGSTNQEGVIRLTNVPDSADAVLRIWHPELGDNSRGVRVAMEEDAASIDVTLDVSDNPPEKPAGLGDRRRSLEDRFGDQ